MAARDATSNLRGSVLLNLLKILFKVGEPLEFAKPWSPMKLKRPICFDISMRAVRTALTIMA